MQRLSAVAFPELPGCYAGYFLKGVAEIALVIITCLEGYCCAAFISCQKEAFGMLNPYTLKIIYNSHFHLLLKEVRQTRNT